MRFALKDYQEEATAKVISGLRRGSREYVEDSEYTAVSLTAPTGAGKTVIAAAVIERTFFGDQEGAVDPDPDAVFLWLTDDPSLNAQTLKKIREASDRIQAHRLVTLDDGFDQARFDPGKVYFLNIQKLGSKANLGKRGGTDKRGYSLWDTISNTIKGSGAHFYLVIDEAHRGTGSNQSKNRLTIAQTLIAGEEGKVLAAPVVLGISATPARFENALENLKPDRLMRKVAVPVDAVRASGLIKDVLSISHRGEQQTMEVTLARQAVARLRESDAAWMAYTEAEGLPHVSPALILQIPANYPEDKVGELLDVCREEWDALHDSAIAHCLDSHTATQFGAHAVPYIKPQNIQETHDVRLVIFKEALTTGWDCPRAEVMVSLRTAKDVTYIAQLIGRMVRTPLARRIEADETLNRVRMYLPNFDLAAVEAVRKKFESDEDVPPTDIVIDAVDANRNSKIPAELFPLTESLPTYVVPGVIHRSQVGRLHRLASLLVGDGLLADAIGGADKYLIQVLESERERLAADGRLAALTKDVENATVSEVSVQIHLDGSEDTESPDADVEITEVNIDARDLDRLYATTKRQFQDGLADKYWAYRVTEKEDDSFEAKILTVALAMEASVVAKVEAEAANRVRQWFDTYGDAIARLSDDKKALYAAVRAMAREPELDTLGLPTKITMVSDEEHPQFAKHLYSDTSGNYRLGKTGSWERHVIDLELGRHDTVGWYRNPTGGQRAIRVPYQVDGAYKKMYPDFIFYAKDDDSGYLRASIVDPHGHHLGDASDKLKGLAAYAAKHSDSYARIVSVIKVGDGFRMLDLKDETVRTAVGKLSGGKEAIETLFNDWGSSYK